MVNPISANDSPAPKDTRDVRMRGFANRSTVDQAIEWLDRQLVPLAAESVSLEKAARRVLARDVVSQANVPGFARSMMDGYAVRAAETLGAGDYNRLSLSVIGECLPGAEFGESVKAGQAVRIMTGAPLPAGADAVLPVELTEAAADRVNVLGEVSPGKHVGTVGEDVSIGDVVLPAGRRLRAQDLGVLSSIGVSELNVLRQPRVRIIVTGDELLPAGSKPQGFQISDANGPMLSALVARDGGVPIYPGIVSDRRQAVQKALEQDADVTLVAGGSSVGQEDHAPMLLAKNGELAIHGISMRPSSPTGMGLWKDGRLVFLLPGNPVSCLCAYDFFAGRAIRALGGRSRDWPYVCKRAPLARKLVSVVGRVDYARVRLTDEGVEPLAIGGASILSSTTRADGFVIVQGDSEGYPPGAEVDVFLYD